jgi:hypothetical protein
MTFDDCPVPFEMRFLGVVPRIKKRNDIPTIGVDTCQVRPFMQIKVDAMDFLEILEQIREVLWNKGRMTYRALKCQFTLDDDYIEDLKAELIDAERGMQNDEWSAKNTEPDPAPIQHSSF